MTKNIGSSQHPYSSVNLTKQPSSYLYDQIQINWGKIQNYTITSKIGRGKYSHVFQGNDLKHKKKVAIKVMLPIKSDKIKRQYFILKSLNHPNIVKLVDIVRCPSQRTASLIFQQFDHVDFRQLYPKLKSSQIKSYMKQLLSALEHLHQNGIMHRDIKPFNVLINPNIQQLKLIDFGLSDFYFPQKQNNVHVASLYYKSPQLFFNNSSYDYRVDIWSAGMIFASMIFGKIPFLQGTDNIDQILKITKIVGTRQVVRYIKDYKLAQKKGHSKQNICFDLLIAFQNGDIKQEKSSTFEEFINETNSQKATWEALDLLKKMLALDYKNRLTAKQALQHPFFGKA